MAINSVNGKALLEKINPNYGQNRNPKGNAYENFVGNLKEKAEKKEAEESLTKATAEAKKVVQVDYRSGKLASELLLQKSGRVEMNALIETSVRHISYSESDHVKVCVTEGYTLKAQVEMDKHKVYIEQKNEDGTYQAYEVNPLKISENTQDPVEQMALEAWEMARELHNNGMFTELEEGLTSGIPVEEGKDEEEKPVTFSEMVDQFEEFVEQRIKDGPPKIQIGGAEFTEEEWKRLLKKIDKDIDAYKEELRERVRRQQEKEALNRTLDQTDGVQKAPYSYLADENGVIVYNGVTFVCNSEKNQICLGDMSNEKNVLTIPLEEGGCLRVNRDNIGELSKAISMFSPEDMGRIMRAIAQDAKVRGVQQEIDEMGTML